MSIFSLLVGFLNFSQAQKLKDNEAILTPWANKQYQEREKENCC